MLFDRSERAQELLEQSCNLPDTATLCVWLRRLDDWRLDALDLLADRFGHEVVVEFATATKRGQPRRGFTRTLHLERRALNNGRELLRALHSTQMGRMMGAGGAPPSSQRAARRVFGTRP
jgi:hypothetical protein